MKRDKYICLRVVKSDVDFIVNGHFMLMRHIGGEHYQEANGGFIARHLGGDQYAILLNEGRAIYLCDKCDGECHE